MAVVIASFWSGWLAHKYIAHEDTRNEKAVAVADEEEGSVAGFRVDLLNTARINGSWVVGDSVIVWRKGVHDDIHLVNEGGGWMSDDPNQWRRVYSGGTYDGELGGELTTEGYESREMK